jgi:hypothetical protein
MLNEAASFVARNDAVIVAFRGATVRAGSLGSTPSSTHLAGMVLCRSDGCRTALLGSNKPLRCRRQGFLTASRRRGWMRLTIARIVKAMPISARASMPV